MIFKSIDRRIRRAFSNSALQYDALTGLHKEIGRELVRKISADISLSKILDVGMGTGWLTNRLKQNFSDSFVVGLDFSDGMINAAQRNYEGFQMVQADARKIPFKNASFDLVISNMAYQWVEDLRTAFLKNWEILKEDGMFLSTMFGYDTFKELFSSLEYSLEGRKKEIFSQQSVRRLPKEKEIRDALWQAGFKIVEVESEWIKVHFPDMMGLLQWTKNIGANQLPKNVYVGKELLARANEYYNTHYRDSFGVVATFAVIWIKALK